MQRYLPLLALITLCSVVSAYVYKCEPGTEPTVCRIWNIHYDRDIAAKHPDRLPSVNFSSTVRTVELLYERYYYYRIQLMLYDLTLHGTVLRNPPIVTIHETRLRHLVMPTNLQLGDFADNVISVIETDPNQKYDLQYLDLADNSLSDVANLTVLARLQTLNLEGNRLRTFGSDVFKRMDNLTFLYLGGNHIATIDLHILPKGLTVLWLTRNQLRALDLAGIVFPALKELDLESNSLSSLDLAALFTAFPALKVVPIAYNTFGKNEAKRIISELKRRNVSYYIGMERDGNVDCDYDEILIDDVCFADTAMNDWSVWKGIVLAVIAVLVVGVFVLSVRWVWYQMNY